MGLMFPRLSIGDLVRREVTGAEVTGDFVGDVVGSSVGAFDGTSVGAFVGASVGAFVGAAVTGLFVGTGVGESVGAFSVTIILDSAYLAPSEPGRLSFHCR